MNISRRAFLGATVGLGALAGLAGISWMLRSQADVIAGIVRAALPDMDISDADLDTFAMEFLNHDKYTNAAYSKALEGLRITGPFVFEDWVRTSLPARPEYLLEQFEREVVTKFIQSSNFFDTYAVGKPGLKYVTYFDPYESPCRNPLARFAMAHANS